MATGRTTEPRSATVTTTNGSAALTAPAATFHAPEDTGRTVTGTGIPAGATLVAVASDTAATLSVAATATGTVAVALGAGNPAAYGLIGWSPETEAEAKSYAQRTTPPDRLTDALTPATSGRRSRQ